MTMPYVTEIESLKSQLSELRAENARLAKELKIAQENFSVTNNAWVERDKEVQELKRDNARLVSLADRQMRELIAHREKAQGNYWAWQGDGVDHLESLSAACPVVISAIQLKAILDDEDDVLCAELYTDLQRHKEALEKAKVALETLSRELTDMSLLLMESQEQEDSTIGKAWRSLLKCVAQPALATINEVLRGEK